MERFNEAPLWKEANMERFLQALVKDLLHVRATSLFLHLILPLTLTLPTATLSAPGTNFFAPMCPCFPPFYSATCKLQKTLVLLKPLLLP